MKHRQSRDTGELAEVRLPLVVAVDVGDDSLDAAVACGFVHGARLKATDSRGNPDLAGAELPLAQPPFFRLPRSSEIGSVPLSSNGMVRSSPILVESLPFSL